MRYGLIGVLILAATIVGSASVMLVPTDVIQENKDQLMLYASLLNAFATFILAASVVLDVDNAIKELRRGNTKESSEQKTDD